MDKKNIKKIIALLKKKVAKITNLIKKIITKKENIYGFLIAILVLFGAFFIWITTFTLPKLDNFEERLVAESTKIYDRTGEIILYDVHGDYKRTIMPLAEISENLINATIAIEDKDFYKHNGIQISSIFRAMYKNIASGSLLGGQGGSTITQQVIKNALLTREKTLTRKIKEWVLAPRLEKELSKDKILEVYLNEIPYGGNVYGAEEAARRYFGKQSKDLSIPESAYLAALPQAPTYFSPYGKNRSALDKRKDFVLDQMVKTGAITKEDAQKYKQEEVEFQKQEDFGIKAPHFVMYIIEQLEEEYGAEVIQSEGLKVITTLDWKLQEKAEEIVKTKALENKVTFDAENAAIVATDPKSGEILVMVGSRDYSDEEIDGNFNVTLAERQPGSSIKPIIYAEAFNKGYRPETVVFDLETEFSTTCSSGGNCYSPQNYDNIFRGPISLRDALAQSVNVPAVKVFYLAGLTDALNLAKKMGLETLKDVRTYGLTLVLGGGEVRPLDMATAYGVFANDGIKYAQTSILKIEDKKGEVLYEDKKENRRADRVTSEQTARLISSVLSDNVARTPAFGSNSFLNFPNNNVAVKTGTTNDYRDAWIVGYTPNISVAAWAGNNDNRSMEKRVAGFIVAPMWNEFMRFAISERDSESFNSPAPIDPNIKPILAGFWKGETIQMIDIETGQPANESTPNENIRNVVSGNTGQGIHSILHWVNRANPLGPQPSNPASDAQYALWESAVRSWVERQGLSNTISTPNTSNTGDSYVKFISPEQNGEYLKDSPLVFVLQTLDGRKLSSGEIFLNNQKIGDLDVMGMSYSFVPQDLNLESGKHILVINSKNQEGEEFVNRIGFSIR
jgi:1A family penicillin-binding protein